MVSHYKHLFCEHLIISYLKIHSNFKKCIPDSKTTTYKCVKDKKNGAESSLIN